MRDHIIQERFYSTIDSFKISHILIKMSLIESENDQVLNYIGHAKCLHVCICIYMHVYVHISVHTYTSLIILTQYATEIYRVPCCLVHDVHIICNNGIYTYMSVSVLHICLHQFYTYVCAQIIKTPIVLN